MLTKPLLGVLKKWEKHISWGRQGYKHSPPPSFLAISVDWGHQQVVIRNSIPDKGIISVVESHSSMTKDQSYTTVAGRMDQVCLWSDGWPEKHDWGSPLLHAVETQAYDFQWRHGLDTGLQSFHIPSFLFNFNLQATPSRHHVMTVQDLELFDTSSYALLYFFFWTIPKNYVTDIHKTVVSTFDFLCGGISVCVLDSCDELSAAVVSASFDFLAFSLSSLRVR